MTIGLDIGEPSAAALTVAEGVEPLQALVTELHDAVAAASTGFRGAAAGGLGAALEAWFDVAGTLSPILEAYSQALATVDHEHAANETVQVDRYSAGGAHLDDRLGGPR